jgi:23S rRNA (pseudouridine1915-N3)-methyltransferase
MARRIGHITIAAVGKLRASHWQRAQADYVRRLEHYTVFNLIEVKDIVGKSMPGAVAVAKEGELLLAAATGRRTILLSEDGRLQTSNQMAETLRAQLEQFGHLVFLIGGPIGFDEAVKAAAHDKWALSPLTFTHELARVILLEQLYRAFTILHGEPYHK